MQRGLWLENKETHTWFSASIKYKREQFKPKKIQNSVPVSYKTCLRCKRNHRLILRKGPVCKKKRWQIPRCIFVWPQTNKQANMGVVACVMTLDFRAKHPNMWISLVTFRFNSCKFRWNYESNFSNFVFCFKFNFVEITLPHFTMELDFELYLKCQLYPLVHPTESVFLHTQEGKFLFP